MLTLFLYETESTDKICECETIGARSEFHCTVWPQAGNQGETNGSWVDLLLLDIYYQAYGLL